MTQVTVTPAKARERGALDGYMLECSKCGLVWSTTVTPDHEAAEHIHYHVRQERAK